MARSTLRVRSVLVLVLLLGSHFSGHTFFASLVAFTGCICMVVVGSMFFPQHEGRMDGVLLLLLLLSAFVLLLHRRCAIVLVCAGRLTLALDDWFILGIEL